MTKTAFIAPASPSADAVETGGVTFVPHRPRVSELLTDAWRSRHLLSRLGIRVIVKGYVGARLGRAWLFLRPTLSIFAMGLLFGAVLNAPSDGVPYVLFLLVGMTSWMAIERFVFWSTRSFDVYRRVVRNLHVPMLTIPLASATPAVLELGVMATLTMLTTLWLLAADGTFYLDLRPATLLVPVGLGLALLLAFSVGVWLSALNARARDVRITLRYFLMVWLYSTPVIYSLDALPASWQFLGTINPAVAPVEIVKWGLLGVGGVGMGSVLVCVGFIGVVGGAGLLFFARMSPRLLDSSHVGTADEEE